jgi:beta-aspartyl-dipeptidase (metallo-type)
VIILIENGDVCAPTPRGRQSVLLVDSTIAKVGAIERHAVEVLCKAMDVDCEVIDASGCVVCPGLIDPHEHLLSGSGEQGFGSMTPELLVEEIVRFGVTTVGGWMVRDGELIKRLRWLEGNKREVRLPGTKVGERAQAECPES